MTHHPARRDTRVLIIDDHELFAESLELALSLEGYDVRHLIVLEVDFVRDTTLVDVRYRLPDRSLLVQTGGAPALTPHHLASPSLSTDSR